MKTTSLRARRFENVASDVYEPLQRYLFRRVHRDSVDDLVAEVMLVVWRRLDEIPTAKALPWCYGVAKNIIGNHRRSEGRRLRLVAKLESEPAVAVGSDPVDGGVDDPALDAALGALSPDDLELVRLWAWEELEPREIAIVLDTTANAVSLRLGRIKKRLAADLRQNGDMSGHIPGKTPDEHVGEM